MSILNCGIDNVKQNYEIANFDSRNRRLPIDLSPSTDYFRREALRAHKFHNPLSIDNPASFQSPP